MPTSPMIMDFILDYHKTLLKLEEEISSITSITKRTYTQQIEQFAVEQGQKLLKQYKFSNTIKYR